jgi:hypothetical protein
MANSIIYPTGGQHKICNLALGLRFMLSTAAKNGIKTGA